MIKNGKSVVIVQQRLTHYCEELFNTLRIKLANSDLRLRVLAGTASKQQLSKNDGGRLDWVEVVPTKYLLSSCLCWQPIRALCADSDLLILPQENALLANHSLLLRRPPHTRLAFWGHGANLQNPDCNSWRERYKRWSTRRVDWWFAYTGLSVGLVADAGFPRDRITCLNNSIDVGALCAHRASVTWDETMLLRTSLGLAQGFTGVFLGSLYKEKRLSFLFAAADRIKAARPDFSLVVIGDGPQADEVRALASSRSWVRMVGSRKAREKALFLSLGDVMLNPGLVGLNVLDSFACGLPMVTTDCGLHSPEVSYLDSSNGMMTSNSVEAYAQICVNLADDPVRLTTLRLGCVRSAHLYSLEAMTERFVQGIVAALEAPPLRKPGGWGRSHSNVQPTNSAAIVTNIPAPYRARVFSLLPQDAFHVIYSARKEPNREWQLLTALHSHEFLRERMQHSKDGFNFRHNNPDVWSALQRQRPKVVVTTGFNPTHLYAFVWATLHRIPHVCMTDGTVESESSLSWAHKLVRRLVFSRSYAFVAASQQGMALYRGYGVPVGQIFQSHLCADNALFSEYALNTDRPFDVMFSGQLQERKLPFLFVDVCGEILRRRGRCAALLLGSGPLRDEVLRRLAALGVEVTYPGFVQQTELPSWYSRAKVMLFTTRMDPWGVVANEALAAGTPVICTPHAGVAGELVVDGETGFVCPAECNAWADAAIRLLDDEVLWARLSRAGRLLVAKYNYQSAADGIQAACVHAQQA